MKHKLLIITTIIISLFILTPTSNALTKEYKDIVSEYTNTEVEEDIINIYLFYGEGCPHCAREKEFFKDELEKEYDNIKIHYFEVWSNEENSEILKKVKQELNLTNNNVPFKLI